MTFCEPKKHGGVADSDNYGPKASSVESMLN